MFGKIYSFDLYQMSSNTKNKNNKGWMYDQLFPDWREWPIAKMGRRRGELVKEVEAFTIKSVHDITNNRANLNDELAKTLYMERIRITQTPWKADKPDEKAFWSGIKKSLLKIPPDGVAPEGQDEEAILQRIVERYSDEIAGNFNMGAYKFAKGFSTFGFARLLNSWNVFGMRTLRGQRRELHEKIKLVGPIDDIRNLATKGTVIMVPTHFSNIDSILIGWAIQSIGLPPFVYGAGLNLFGIKLLAFFMNRLGAYKVDRRRKNLIYLETLKAYSTLALRHGSNSLFFPGGTRSRSGALESKLKLGLLGTAFEAQRLNYIDKPNEHGKKIYVVPVVFNYNFVLEAPSLINEHLKRSGQEQYYDENRSGSSSINMFKFLYKFLTVEGEMSISFGKPMDLFGNDVNSAGQSVDRHGRQVDIMRYFITNGVITHDQQREAEYTRMLGEEIVKRYHKENMAYPSHLVAYTAFEIIKKRHKKLDLYSLLRLPEDDHTIEYDEFYATIDHMVSVLKQMRDEGKIRLDDDFDRLNTKAIIEEGVRNSGIYHAQRPVKISKEGTIASDDFNLLYYYHNRLEGYGLNKHI
jgi:glycerol-3-phosphate O-acyltransferase